MTLMRRRLCAVPLPGPPDGAARSQRSPTYPAEWARESVRGFAKAEGQKAREDRDPGGCQEDGIEACPIRLKPTQPGPDGAAGKRVTEDKA